MSLPVRRNQFKVGPFAAWLAENGAEVGTPTNPYEVIRYRAFWCGSKRAVTHVVYAKETGLLTFTFGTADHYRAFMAGEMLNDQRPRVGAPINHHALSSASQKDKLRRKLLARDGDECWFCGLAMGADMTIEHLVAKAKGGPNHHENYALAHAACNHAAGDLPLIQKIEMRSRLRAENGVVA